MLLHLRWGTSPWLLRGDGWRHGKIEVDVPRRLLRNAEQVRSNWSFDRLLGERVVLQLEVEALEAI